MRKNNLVIKEDETSDRPQETARYSNQGLNGSYIGKTAIRGVTLKTEEGHKIEDLLGNNTIQTAVIPELLSGNKIMPMKNFYNPPQELTSHSVVLKKWRGHVESVEGNEFEAVLTDASETESDIRAAFSIDEVSEGDRGLVRENALFDWVISRERKSHGQIENKDFLVFRRFPMWKKDDLDLKSAKVDAFDEWLGHPTSTK